MTAPDSLPLDVLLNGQDATHDTRHASDVAAIVTAELARGSSLPEACLAAVIPCETYLGWVLDDPQLMDAHQRALTIRSHVLADAPLSLAREVRAVRTGEAMRAPGVALREVVGAIEAEARLLATARASANTEAAVPPTLRVVFDAPPTHALPAPAPDTASVGAETDARDVSDDAPGDYVVIESDPLDA